MTFFGDVVASHLLPRQVLEVVQQGQHSHFQTGLTANGYCWVLCSHQLFVWRFKDGLDARVKTLRLPVACTSGSAGSPAPSSFFVCILPQQQASTISVLVCSDQGNLAVWLDCNYLAEPVTQQIVAAAGARQGSTAAVASFTAVSNQQGASGPAFLAALAGVDGSWYLIQGSSQGIVTKQLAAPAAKSEAKGVLNALGSVISYAYTEAFDPAAKYIKRLPSGKPAVGIHLEAVDPSHVRVLLLTEQTVDCWMVNLGLRPSEQLLWSFHTLQALQCLQPDRQVQQVTNLALAVDSGCACVWMLKKRRDGSTLHAVMRLQSEADSNPIHELIELDEYCAAIPEHPQPGQPRPQVICDSAHLACLLLAPDRSVTEARLHDASVEVITNDPDNLAVALSRGGSSQPAGAAAAAEGGRWVVLSATYGVMEVAVGTAGKQMQQSSAPLTLEREQQVGSLLDAACHQASQALAQGQPLIGTVAGLSRRLEALGAFYPSANMAVLAAYSTGILDMLPKQWALGGGGAAGAPGAAAGGGGAPVHAAGGVSLKDQLAEKVARHGVYLQCLAESGVLPRLSGEVLRVLLENSEKLAVASNLLALYTQHLAGSGEGNQPTSNMLLQVITRAGQLSSSPSHEVLHPAEIFFARPSASAPALLRALQEAGQALGAGALGEMGPRTLLSHCLSLGQVLGSVTEASQRVRDGLQQRFRLEARALYGGLGATSWLAGGQARAAGEALVQAILAARQHLADPLDRMELAHCLLGVAEILLSAFAAAVAVAPATLATAPTTAGATATQGAGSTKAALLSEYRAARQQYLAPLAEDAVSELRRLGLLLQPATASHAAAAAALAAPPPPDCLLHQLEQLCANHHCYSLLFDTCEILASAPPAQQSDLGSMGATSVARIVGAAAAPSRLHLHMASMGPEDGATPGDTFTNYVFARLLRDSRPADLLSLPREFWPVLRSFLQPHPALLGLLLLRSGEWQDGAATLVQDAQAAKDNLASHRRKLCLAKLAAHAASTAKAPAGPASPADSSTTDAPAAATVLEACDAGLGLLLQQERLGRGAEGVMAPEDLAEAALQAAPSDPSGESALAALEVLLLMGPGKTRELHSSKWQAAWRQLLAATDWAALHARRASLPDNAWNIELAATPLFRGARACCGRGAFGFGASVSDSEPIAEVAGWLQQWTGAGTDQQDAGCVMQAFQLALSGYIPEAAVAAAVAGGDVDAMVS